MEEIAIHSEFINSVNILLAPVIGLIIILVDCRHKSHYDKTQIRLMVFIIVFALATMLSELSYDAVNGVDGNAVRVICWAANTFYLLFQNVTFGLLALFLDYNTNGDLSRLRKLCVFFGAILALSLASLVLNLFTGYLFTISPDNYYSPGKFHAARLGISYLFMLIILVNATISRKHMNKSLYALVLLSVLPAAIGSTLDILFINARLSWSCIFPSILFGYLFIVRINLRTDSLTSVHNRRSFDEYLNNLAKTTRHKDYSFIMIDIDKFKEINDTYGHMQGDNALQDVAEILRSSVRRVDFVARYGGDEFVIIAEMKETDILIRRIIDEIDALNAKKIRPYTLELSCGSGLYTPDDSRTPQEFLASADSLMYMQKNKRRSSE